MMMMAALIDGGVVRPLPRPELKLGEAGRGRTLVLVPVLAERPTEWRGVPDWPDRVSVELTESGPRIIRECREDDRVLLAIKGDPGYYRGAEYSIQLPEGARVLARGRGAYGDAGRLGGWEEILVILPPDGELVWRARFSRHIIRWDPERIRVLSPSQAAAEDAAAAPAKEVI